MSSDAAAALGIDQVTAWAWGLVPLGDDREVQRWSDTLRRAVDQSRDEGDDSWDELRERISTTASEEGIDGSAVEVFIESVSNAGEGTELIERMLELSGKLPELYWRLREPDAADVSAYGGETTASPFAWLRPDHQDQLASWWGSEWPDTLSAQLEARWGSGWQGHPDEHQAAWFEDAMREWSGESGGQAEAKAEPEAAAEQLTSEAAVELVERALAELMAEVPGAEELSPEDLVELRAELLEELNVQAR